MSVWPKFDLDGVVDGGGDKRGNGAADDEQRAAGIGDQRTGSALIAGAIDEAGKVMAGLGGSCSRRGIRVVNRGGGLDEHAGRRFPASRMALAIRLLTSRPKTLPMSRESPVTSVVVIAGAAAQTADEPSVGGRSPAQPLFDQLEGGLVGERKGFSRAAAGRKPDRRGSGGDFADGATGGGLR